MNPEVLDALRDIESACMRLRWALEDTPKPNGEFVRHDGEPVTMRMILFATAKVTGISKETLLGKRRGLHAAIPRRLAIYLTAKLCPHRSFPEIGTFFHKDHTTVMHARRKAEAQLEADPDFAETYRLVCAELAVTP